MSFTVPPAARSWIAVDADSHFPIQNLPFGMKGDGTLVTRVGDTLVSLPALAAEGLLPGQPGRYASLESLARSGGSAALSEVRRALYELIEASSPRLRDDAALREAACSPADDLHMALPMRPGAFLDFYSGIHHASNVGRMFRPEQPPLLPNYRHLPVGYNGRASSVVPSGVPVRRPKGQTKAPDADGPAFGPSRELDFELEMGFYLAEGCELGESIAVADAERHMAGMVIVNDWSARDVQRWEYQPLGPFLSKSFLTSVSPWLVTLDALEPFRVAGMAQEPEPLPHLRRGGDQIFDIRLEVRLQSARMTAPVTICTSNTKHLYWSMAQQLAHQTSNGTNVQVGDLYASGTISGEDEGTFGSLLELTWRGQSPIRLEETFEEREFLEDGDVVTMTAYALGDGFRVGFGEVTALVLPAKE
ncbi:MAG: fumarylacetoacetase [Fimbriimonadaceae bacterium]|nr:fumarylacetoacetase [Chthonomonadaceae bacterium]MCO5295608.1 fumarylacetoacetase [Fimbriimonadaceae bacterium]